MLNRFIESERHQSRILNEYKFETTYNPLNSSKHLMSNGRFKDVLEWF